MIASLSKEQTRRCLFHLQEQMDSCSSEVLYLNLGDVKTIRVICCHPDAATMVRRQLSWSLTQPVEQPEATLYFGENSNPKDFHRTLLGLHFDRDETDEYLLLVTRDGEKLIPFAEITQGGAVRVWGDNLCFYTVPNMEPECLLKEGHLFVQLLYRLINTSSAHLIHGACVGVDNKGILLCARGAKGKSTLTVTAMLRGFEYVADDYLILERENDLLKASPIYSIITLSPKMYNKLYDDLDRAHFVCNSPWKDKYILDISAYETSVQRNYPIYACMFPEIVPDSEPSVIACTPQEKGRAITHMIHSTIGQMNDQGNAPTVKKLVGMLSAMKFYRIRLSPDIVKNAECLREFVKQINS